MSEQIPVMEQTFHTITEVAERLHLSPKTVRRLIAQGKLKVHRFG